MTMSMDMRVKEEKTGEGSIGEGYIDEGLVRDSDPCLVPPSNKCSSQSCVSRRVAVRA